MVNIRRVLLAILPIISQPPTVITGQILSDIPVYQYICSHIAATLEICGTITVAAALLHGEESNRPELGGERITEDWLRSLSDRECLWRFRSVFKLQPIDCIPTQI
jgi:hypothetical protein